MVSIWWVLVAFLAGGYAGAILIGLMSMGTIALVALTRVNLLQRRVEPFPGEEHIKKEPVLEKIFLS